MNQEVKRRDTIVFWKKSLLHQSTKLTHQTLYREKSVAEVFFKQWLNVEDCVWNGILLYSYHWICTDCNKDLIYGKRFRYRLLLLLCSSLSLLLPFLLLYYFYYWNFRCYISIVIIIIINIGLILTTIIIIFVNLLFYYCIIVLSLLTFIIYHYSFQ